MSNVRSLHGDELPAPGTPNQRVVDLLERALAAAKSGEIAGVLLVQVDHRVSASWELRGAYVASYTGLGAVRSAEHAIAEKVNEECW